jgi:thiol-disulfide isomerase/thioredoxin
VNWRAWLLLSAVSCSGRPLAVPHAEPLSSSEPVVGRAVGDLDLQPLGQRKGVRLSEYRGKAVLLNVWASWCAPCRQELPMLDEAVERLRAKGVEIVAVTVDESAQDAEEFLRSRPSWSLTFAHDPGARGLRRLDVPKMPTSYVIDTSGVVREVHASSDQEDFRALEGRLVELGAAR